MMTADEEWEMDALLVVLGKIWCLYEFFDKCGRNLLGINSMR
jgi:hypothetical protein